MTVHANALTRDLADLEYNGVTHSIKPIKGRSYQTLLALRRAEHEGEATDPMEYYRILHQCVPTMTWDEVLDLDAFQVSSIIAIADGKIKAVEALLPKATPAETAATEPGPVAEASPPSA
jgi:hypothetical protein